MARSSYVYVVSNTRGVQAAFTVKHECVAWLRKWAHLDQRLWLVERLSDGATRPEAYSRQYVDQFLADNP